MECDGLLGSPTTEKILLELDVSRRYFCEHSNWISVDFLDAFLDKFAEAGGKIAELSTRAGHRGMSKDVLGIKYSVLRLFGTPEMAFRQFPTIACKFNLGRTYRVVPLGRGHVRVALGTTYIKLPKHREACLNWKANFEEYFTLMKSGAGAVSEISCCFDGAPACTYDIQWNSQKHRTLYSALGVALFTLLWLAISCFGFSYYLTTTLAALALSVGWSMRANIQAKSDADALADQVAQIEDESADKVGRLDQANRALQASHAELKLIEGISRRIQRAQILENTLDEALKAACTQLGFDRAFIMLKHPVQTILETRAVYAVGVAAEPIRNFRIDVSEPRHEDIFASSVFHSSKSVCISDVMSHISLLNEASQKIIALLKSRGFIIVAIPGRHSNLGIMIADVYMSPIRLGMRETSLLEGLAQHLGLAIERSRDLAEQKMRNSILEKTLVSRFFKEIMDLKQPALGGEQKDIVCMFIDIRGFTSLCERYASELVVELLNRFWGRVVPLVYERNGYIDRFLGDGCMAVWDHDTLPKDCVLAVQAALTIIDATQTLRREFEVLGLPTLVPGIGIACGSATIARVGAEQKVEYTAIGIPVNYAARIEALCKEFDTNLVISESVASFLDNDVCQYFETIKNVCLKNVENKIVVRAYRGGSIS